MRSGFSTATGTWFAPASLESIQLPSTNKIVSLPLPFGEGVVIKSAGDPAGGTWFKVKQVDFADLELVEVLPGTGKYSDSVGRLVVRNPENGALGEVGSFAITDDASRVDMEPSPECGGSDSHSSACRRSQTRGAPRAGVVMDFHEGKGPTEAGLLMYSERLSGGDQEQMMRTKYRVDRGRRMEKVVHYSFVPFKPEEHPDWRKSSGIPVPRPEDFERARRSLDRACQEHVLEPACP
jgi:hypothetical protein